MSAGCSNKKKRSQQRNECRNRYICQPRSSEARELSLLSIRILWKIKCSRGVAGGNTIKHVIYNVVVVKQPAQSPIHQLRTGEVIPSHACKYVAYDSQSWKGNLKSFGSFSRIQYFHLMKSCQVLSSPPFDAPSFCESSIDSCISIRPP